MTTALDIIKSAMGKIGQIGAGETPSGDDTSLCLERLNSLLDTLDLESVYAFTTLETVFTLPAATSSRTIGPTLQIDMARPTRLLDRCYTTLQGIDRELKVLSEPEFNMIALKDLDGFVPEFCYYSAGIPTGEVHFYPRASSAVEVHLFTPNLVNQIAFDDIATALELSAGYKRFLEYALAVEIAPDFNTQPTALLLAAATNAKRTIKRSNYIVPQLRMDDDRQHQLYRRY